MQAANSAGQHQYGQLRLAARKERDVNGVLTVDHGALDGEMQAPGRPHEDAEGLYTRRLGDSAAVVSGGA